MGEPKSDQISRVTVGEVFLVSAGTALVFLPGLCALLLLCTLLGCLPRNLAPGIVGLAVALLPLAVADMPSVKDRWRPALRRMTKAGVVLSLAVLAGTGGWDAYQAAITISDFTIDTSRYRPFTANSQIARLEGEASLRFSAPDDLPVPDGEASLFPPCAAMVNATYPESAFLHQAYSTVSYLDAMGYYRYLDPEDTDICFATAPAEGREWPPYFGWDDGPAEPQTILLGGQALVFFTSAANPVEGLTRDQLRGIYSGTVTNWAEVGGEDVPILPYQHGGSRGPQAALERFMGKAPLVEPLIEVRHWMSGRSGEYLADYRNTPGAIGFTYYIYAAQLQEKYPIKLLAVDGVYPDGETIGQGRYPITDGFYLVVRPGERREETERFIAWALGEEGQELVARAGYVPVEKMNGRQ